MDLGLRGRTYVVTGGSSGLGLAGARALVGDGARVVVSSRSQERVDDAVAALGGEDVAVGMVADNADPDTPERLVETAFHAFGGLDGALLSVGGPPPGLSMDVSDEQWSDAFSSVFLGAVRLCREVGAALARDDDADGSEPHGRGAAIALVLSTTVRKPIADLAISGGLRPGLAMMVNHLAAELGPRDVRVVGLLPGTYLTGRVASVYPDADAQAEQASSVPLRRLGDPDELGRVAAFVLSPAASYLTGTCVTVDGGSLQVL